MSESNIITVHVTPRSGRDVVSGIRHGERGAEEICVRVTAPPDEGRANKAVCRVVASSLGVPKTAVSVTGGRTSRRKRLTVETDAGKVAQWMAALPRL